MKTKNILQTVLAVFLLFASNKLLPQSTWNSLCTGSTNGIIYTSVVFNDTLYVGGDFTSICGVSADRIAKWTGNTWAAVGAGMNNTVRALTVYTSGMNSYLIAGGDFTTSGSNTVNFIAQWDGSSWNPLAIGLNGNVHALTSFGGFLYAGGEFTNAGGNSAIRLARWTGSGWFALGLGVNDIAYALIQSPFSATELIVGGKFTMSGSSTANRVARFTNFGFLGQLGSGMDDGEVLALAAYTLPQVSIYVGGSFTMIGGIPVSKIGRWNGSSWFPVGSGADNSVYSLYTSATVQSGTNILVAGGLFATMGGVGANSIAAWNGSSWSTLGTGMTGGSPTNVRVSRDFRATLSAEGSFTSAGGTPSNNSALWGSQPGIPTLVSPCGPPNPSPNNVLLDWNDVTNAWRYRVQVSTNPNFTTTTIDVSGIAASQYAVQPGILLNSTTYYWRVNATNALGTSNYSLTCVFTTSPVGLIINTNEIPGEFRLYQNFPNPFNPTTLIKFDIPSEVTESGLIELTLLDLTGRESAKLVVTDYKAGKYEFTFNAGNLASGLYFYRLKAGNFVQTKKMILMK